MSSHRSCSLNEEHSISERKETVSEWNYNFGIGHKRSKVHSGTSFTSRYKQVSWGSLLYTFTRVMIKIKVILFFSFFIHRWTVISIWSSNYLTALLIIFYKLISFRSTVYKNLYNYFHSESQRGCSALSNFLKRDSHSSLCRKLYVTSGVHWHWLLILFRAMFSSKPTAKFLQFCQINP